MIVARLRHIHPDTTRAICHTLGRAAGCRPAWQRIARRLLPEPSVEALHRFARDDIEYRREVGEVIQTAGVTLRRGYGDCDCKSVLVGTLAEAMGWPWRLWLLARVGGRFVSIPAGEKVGGRRAFHIWPEVHDGERWRHVEACDRRARFDEHPADVIRRVKAVRF